MSDRVRAFLAIRLPRELVEAAARIQAAVRGNVPDGVVRWVDPDNFHLTVRFFGDLDPGEVERATAVVQNLRFDEMTVRLGRLSAFPSASRPQILWMGLASEDDRLGMFVRDLDRRLREAGFGPADKPWKSHLTLGRIVRGARVLQGWNRGISIPPEEFRLDMLSLMQSELLPSGARHTALATVGARAD